MQRWCWIMSRFPGRCKDFSLWGVFTIWHTSRSILLSSFIYLWLYTLGKKASVLAVKRPSLSTNQTLTRTQIDPHTEICLCFCPPTHTHTHAGLPLWVIFLPSVWSLFLELRSRPRSVIRPAAFLSTRMFVVLVVSEFVTSLDLQELLAQCQRSPPPKKHALFLKICLAKSILKTAEPQCEKNPPTPSQNKLGI